jgi:hypothetical protein
MTSSPALRSKTRVEQTRSEQPACRAAISALAAKCVVVRASRGDLGRRIGANAASARLSSRGFACEKMRGASDPIDKRLEVHTLDASTRRWREVRIYQGDTAVRAAPFDVIELDPGALWSPPRTA